MVTGLKVAHGPRQKPLYIGDDLKSRYVRVMVRVTIRRGLRRTPHGRPLFNSNNFATSAALAEVCALLSAVPVYVLVVLGPRRPDGQHKRYKDCSKTMLRQCGISLSDLESPADGTSLRFTCRMAVGAAF